MFKHFQHAQRIKIPMLASAVLILSCLFSGHAWSEELELINRPVSSSGLTGLIATETPYTMPRGILEVGVSGLSETSAVPDTRLTELPFTITYGSGESTEIALRASYLYREEGLDPARYRGMGDAELAFKHMVLGPREGSWMPVVAVMGSVLGLTGDADDLLNRVHNWGASAGVCVGKDLPWEDHMIGLYADLSMNVKDLDDPAYRDRFTSVNAGALIPISKRHNLQIILEYGVVTGKDVPDVDGAGSSTITFGVRMVSERLNLTVGSQFIHKQLEGYDNSSRVMGTLSFKFDTNKSNNKSIK